MLLMFRRPAVAVLPDHDAEDPFLPPRPVQERIAGSSTACAAGPTWKDATFLAAMAVFLSALSSAADAAPPGNASIQARLGSCDPAVVRSAADELLRDPKTLAEPLMLFHAASAERAAGRKEEAAFLYLAAHLRTSRQILFERGDRPQLLTIMTMTIGPQVLPAVASDPDLASRVVKRVIDWDRSTPDPFRDRKEARSGETAKKLAEIDAGLRRLPDQIRNDPSRIAAAREENERAERQIKATRAQTCGPGTVDAIEAEAAAPRIKGQAELLVKNHPLVLSRAGGSVKSARVATYDKEIDTRTKRMTVSVTPAAGKPFFAEVDAVATITPDRRLGGVRLSLACLTDLWIGQRQSSWKDVCEGDPNAIRPAGTAGSDLARFDIDADGRSRESPPPVPVCGFRDLKLPADFSVVAAGAGPNAGRTLSYQIDQSGYAARQIDVAVNSPDRPVALLLGSYEPTIWNVSWSKETRILAVLIGGHHRQVAAGLERSVPLLVSTHDNKGPCEFYARSADKLAESNFLSRRAFGRPVETLHSVTGAAVQIGKPLSAGVVLVSSPDVTPESFYDKNVALAGRAGLEDAVRKGLLRKATAADAQAWVDAVERANSPRIASPAAGAGGPVAQRPSIQDAYVVLKPFVYPAALGGANAATFFVPGGVARPGGDPGHSAVYDFNTLRQLAKIT